MRVSLEAAVRTFAETQGLKLGEVAQPLRAALTGSTVSPPIFEVMAVLGRDGKPGASRRCGSRLSGELPNYGRPLFCPSIRVLRRTMR